MQRCSLDDDNSYTNSVEEVSNHGSLVDPSESQRLVNRTKADPVPVAKDEAELNGLTNRAEVKPEFEFCLPCKWSTGTGPRISIVRDYPMELQTQALEKVNLSPRVGLSPADYCGRPIPSPRPSPKVRVSPRLAYMGHISPRTPKVRAYWDWRPARKIELLDGLLIGPRPIYCLTNRFFPQIVFIYFSLLLLLKHY